MVPNWSSMIHIGSKRRKPVNELVFKQTSGGLRKENVHTAIFVWADNTNAQTMENHWHACSIERPLITICVCGSGNMILRLRGKKTTKTTIATWKISKYDSQRDKTSKTTDIAFFLPLKWKVTQKFSLLFFIHFWKWFEKSSLYFVVYYDIY